MSRIGNKPIPIPKGVTDDTCPVTTISVKGPKGQLSVRRSQYANVTIEEEGGELTASNP